MASGRELIEAIAGRYRVADRHEKQEILDEFTQAIGFHRQHAIRVLAQKPRADATTGVKSRLYDEAVVPGVTIIFDVAK